MTSLLARSPLHHMSSNRAPARRRSTRHPATTDDETQEPPAKKAKTSDARAKKAYDEADGGFAFTRGRTRRGATKAAAEPVAEAVKENVKEVAAPTERRARKTMPASPAERPRRSKRLSGESGEDPFTARGSPAPEAAEIHVPKRRETKIGLLFAETPVIRRNKAMRQTSHESSRRSSAGLRGKRASSLMDAGTRPVPHAEVRTEDFYKHISQDLLEPRRMRQLLVWCGARALTEKCKIGERVEEGERQAIQAARVVQEELLADFAAKGELSNWFDRPDEPAPAHSLVKKPNPRNVANAAKLVELEEELSRLKNEKAAWDALAQSVPSPPPEDDDAELPPLDPASIDPALLPPEAAAQLEALLAPHPDQNEVQSRLDAAASDLRFKLDAYHDALHRMERFVAIAGEVADHVLAAAAGRLEERDQQRKDVAAAGKEKIGQGAVLKALGAALEKERR